MDSVFSSCKTIQAPMEWPIKCIFTFSGTYFSMNSILWRIWPSRSKISSFPFNCGTSRRLFSGGSSWPTWPKWADWDVIITIYWRVVFEIDVISSITKAATFTFMANDKSKLTYYPHWHLPFQTFMNSLTEFGIETWQARITRNAYSDLLDIIQWFLYPVTGCNNLGWYITNINKSFLHRFINIIRCRFDLSTLYLLVTSW